MSLCRRLWVHDYHQTQQTTMSLYEHVLYAADMFVVHRRSKMAIVQYFMSAIPYLASDAAQLLFNTIRQHRDCKLQPRPPFWFLAHHWLGTCVICQNEDSSDLIVMRPCGHCISRSHNAFTDSEEMQTSMGMGGAVASHCPFCRTAISQVISPCDVSSAHLAITTLNDPFPLLTTRIHHLNQSIHTHASTKESKRAIY